MTTDVILYEEKQIADVFKHGGADDILAQIKDRVKSIVTDVTTPKGRKEIASLAHKIATSKTALDNKGKELKEEHKKICDVIDAERKKIRDELDLLKEEFRKPLTDFENREKERVESHNNAINEIKNGCNFDVNDPEIEIIDARIVKIDSILNRQWDEFLDQAKQSHELVLSKLTMMRDDRKKRDDERAELERLRKEKEDRERLEREEALKKEAADKARREAEEKAEREKQEAAAKAKEEHERIEREKLEAEQRALKAEADRVAAEEKAANDAKLAKEQAEREKQEAIELERKRIEDEKKAQLDIIAKRESDLKHKKSINNEAKKAMYEILKAGDGIAFEDAAQMIIEAIAKGKIPHVKISY